MQLTGESGRVYPPGIRRLRLTAMCAPRLPYPRQRLTAAGTLSRAGSRGRAGNRRHALCVSRAFRV